jgi:hypothetical protein
MKNCKNCQAKMHYFSVVCMKCGGGVLAITKLTSINTVLIKE